MPATCCSCTKKYYKVKKWRDPLINEVKNSPELEVGDFDSNRHCQALNNVKHDVVTYDKAENESVLAWYRTSSCKVVAKSKCETFFDIKMLGN